MDARESDTLVRAVADERVAEWRDLDRPQDRQSAVEDPTGFVAFEELTVIDEIQRVPELLLAIKATVDADPRPGRFLLTGSSRLLGLRDLPDTLPGRMETIELWPFSQGDRRGSGRFRRCGVSAGPGDAPRIECVPCRVCRSSRARRVA